MKFLKKPLLALFLVISGHAVGQVQIMGEWATTCQLETINKSNYLLTKLCKVKLNQENDQWYVLNFQMKIGLDSIHFSFDDGTKTVPYQYNQDDNKVSFVLENEPFHFSVSWIVHGKSCSWIEARGWVLLLSRIE